MTTPTNTSTTFSEIITYFNAAWDFAAIPVRYDNFGAIQNGPASKVESDDNVDNFIDVSFQPFNLQQRDMGSAPFSRLDGLLVIRIFTKKDQGQLKAMQIYDTVKDVFLQSKGAIGGILFRESTISTYNEDDDFFVQTATFRTENNFIV